MRMERKYPVDFVVDISTGLHSLNKISRILKEYSAYEKKPSTSGTAFDFA